jgi:hypothetical protein
MAKSPWHVVVQDVRPHIVRIMTPRGSGTGFLLYNSQIKGFSAVATAAHVVNAAHFWEEPLRLQHPESGKTALIRPGNRAILLNEAKDVAAIMFDKPDLPLPEEPLSLSEGDKYIKVGVEIGWLGFPAISNELCFFGGRISAYLESEERYLVDGVAINGVSGGPAFKAEDDETVSVIGVLSAYMPNRATGETLPGLAVVTDVVEFHKMVASFKNFDQAKAQETPPSSSPAAPTEEPPTSPPAPSPSSEQPNSARQPTASMSRGLRRG